MFRTIVLSVLFAVALAGNPSLAQTPDQEPPPGDEGAPSGAPPSMGSASEVKQLVADCRSQARGEGLSGDALRSAVIACVGAQRPRAAARLRCREQGRARGIYGDELKGFVQNCIAQGHMGAQRRGPPSEDDGGGYGGPQQGGPSEEPMPGGPQQGERPAEGAQRPRAAARLQCREQGKAQGIYGEELKGFVQNCMAQGYMGAQRRGPPSEDDSGASDGQPQGGSSEEPPPGPPGGSQQGEGPQEGMQRPQAAARLQCRQQGQAQGMFGEDLRAFVRNCMAQR
jgi:hypothetical protein